MWRIGMWTRNRASDFVKQLARRAIINGVGTWRQVIDSDVGFGTCGAKFARLYRHAFQEPGGSVVAIVPTVHTSRPTAPSSSHEVEPPVTPRRVAYVYYAAMPHQEPGEQLQPPDPFFKRPPVQEWVMTNGADSSRADLTRMRLLEAAVASFAERGFHGTTTRNIAAASGMSPAAVYVHHKSKEELLYLISKAGHERILELVRTAFATETKPDRQLAAMMRTFASDHAQAHTRARVVNYELAALNESHFNEIRRVRRAISAEVRSLVQRGVDAGVFDTPDVNMAATALLSLNIDIARWYREPGPWSPDDVGEFYSDMALRIVGARRPRKKSRATR